MHSFERMMRALLSLVLAVSMLLNGFAAAYARGANPAVDRIVICAGHVMTVIYVDAEGHETTHPQLCPDCAPHLAEGMTQPAQVMLPALFPTYGTGMTGDVFTSRCAAQVWHARAPPFLV